MSKNVFTRSLAIYQASGTKVNINLFLPKKPVREEQKLKTLTKYIQQYPSGWKKRLELAELLYGMGKWTEAVEEFYQVIERQPQLIQVRLKLGKILQLMGKEKEAIEVYKSALSLVSNLKFSSPVLSNITQSNKATQSHIMGLIEVCRHDFSKAVESFKLATTFEPDNPSHCLALGQVQRSIGNNMDAMKAFETILSHHPDDLIALINIYDTLMALGNDHAQLSSNSDFLNSPKTEDKLEKTSDSIGNIWYIKAEKILSKAIILAPNNYQVLKRQI